MVKSSICRSFPAIRCTPRQIGLALRQDVIQPAPPLLAIDWFWVRHPGSTARKPRQISRVRYFRYVANFVLPVRTGADSDVIVWSNKEIFRAILQAFLGHRNSAGYFKSKCRANPVIRLLIVCHWSKKGIDIRSLSKIFTVTESASAWLRGG